MITPSKLEIEAIIRDIRWESERHGLILKTQQAYILATVEHETNGTFLPISEAYWLSDPDKYLKTKAYYPYYGRGYVQLTWKVNYEKYSKILQLDLVANPDIVKAPIIAQFILCHGFRHGTFTGKGITEYINQTKTDFINARRCINILDRAEFIAQKVDKYL